MSNSLWPHGLQPTRLLRPWDFPGKSTGVGCHCLLRMFAYKVLSDLGSIYHFGNIICQSPPMHLGSSGKEFTAMQWGERERQRRLGFSPRVGKISWRRKWQPTPVFLSGKTHELRILVGYSPWGCEESDTTEHAHYSSPPDQLCSGIICLLSVPCIDSSCLGSVRLHCALDLEPYSPCMCISLFI